MHILFDIGGTNMRVAVSVDGATLGEVKKIATPPTLESGVEALVAMAKELAGGESITAVAGGIAGGVDRKTGFFYGGSNLSEGWRRKPLREMLRNQLGVPVFLENDAALVGLGEAVYGAGKGKEIVVYITVSTGVGGARIVAGKIDTSVYGFEPGHQVIDMHGPICKTCGVPGDLESLISGTAVAVRMGKPAYEVPQADPLWDELAHTLALGLNNTAVFWSPDVIVLGGSMMVGDPVIQIEHVTKHFNKILNVFAERPEIRRASLQDAGGLWGALALIRQQEH